MRWPGVQTSVSRSPGGRPTICLPGDTEPLIAAGRQREIRAASNVAIHDAARVVDAPSLEPGACSLPGFQLRERG